MSEEYGYEILRASPDALLIAADWFEEQGRDGEAKACRDGLVDEMALALSLAALSYGYGSGSGYGYGYGYGSGYGYGYGSGSGSGSGYGYGYGSGSGSGYGYGYGSGYGYGYGSGYGRRLISFYREVSFEDHRMNHAKLGDNYLVYLPFGLGYVGRFVAAVGLTGGEFEDVSNVHDTGNGNNWSELAAGRERDGATFKRFEGIATFPTVLAAFQWAGKLPG